MDLPFRENSAVEAMQARNIIIKAAGDNVDHHRMHTPTKCTLFIPAMSAETERVFSDTKLFISESRSRLGPAIIEPLECARR
jgi:hAT family C-terminal dimerisation region